jgi:DNA-binding HxlR family transcriptional regulator
MSIQQPACAVETEQVRDVLETIADKWTLVVLDALDGETRRFADLQRTVGGISQKVLTQTLRNLERNGFVTRTVFPEVPPRVEYALTTLGSSVCEAMCGLWQWTDAHHAEVLAARARFDGARIAPAAGAAPPPPAPDRARPAVRA